MSAQQILSITFGYSDSEDRLWARCVLAGNNESRFWLTRRLTLALIHALAEKLHKTLPALPVPMEDSLRLAMEYQAALDAPADSAPAQPSTARNHTGAMPLCHSIDITPSPDKPWGIQWRLENRQALALSPERNQVHRVLAILISRAEAAGWAPALAEGWLISEIRETLLGQDSAVSP